jgi:PTH1 family peptidyl-tRNA hydrolase
MLLLVGLGNPGPRYAGHRHNVGFMAVDEIVRRRVFSPWRARFNGEVAEGHLGGERTLILKPMTFMNESSKAVGEAVRFLKIPLDRVVVFHDELDLAPGRIRMKKGGGAGGHNGLRDIDAHVGKDYRRVRIGIGHPGIKEMVTPHVLGDFAKTDREWLDPLLDAIADSAGLLIKGDESGFMNHITLALREKLQPTGDDDRPPPKQPKARSHIRQARQQAPATKLPETGPMAALLKKLFGKE